jgi:hypothetical protein
MRRMETQVRTPHAVFNMPQRLVVPLFQRPYVWNQENQWEPLWNDVVLVTERLLAKPYEKQYPHFLGAVVLQQAHQVTGSMQMRTIIDGQQRLTTIQLMLDALHAELLGVEAITAALRIEPLITNAAPFCSRPEDRFKVWPTNRDRPPFNAVMGAAPPVNHDALGFPGERMVEAHRFFTEQAREWLSADSDSTMARANAIETVVRELLQMVVIDLNPDENAQEIFETLNARGAQLTAADLIKNFVFQRLLESNPTGVEAAYERFWKEFETGFWEAEVNVGRIRHQRSSVFLNHWLIERTATEVVAREVFARFKRFADHEAGMPMLALLERIHSAATIYRGSIGGENLLAGPIDRVGLFVYRTGVMESEVVKPLLLYLLDPQEPPIPQPQLHKALDAVESWMVRRMLVRATTKAYNQMIVELVKAVRDSGRAGAGDLIEAFLANQKGDSRYWPDDEEIRTDLRTLLAYRRLGRGRLRMVLEAVEDHLRGWKHAKTGLGEERVARGRLAIEHVMPRKWAKHWGTAPGHDADRDRLIHTLGNLTLLTGRLNASVSNGPWLGSGGKRDALHRHDVLMINREFREYEQWTDEDIRRRTDRIANMVMEIWPVPAGHRSGYAHEKVRPRHKVDLLDLMNAGMLQAPKMLVPRSKRHASRIATLLPNGQIEVDGRTYGAPSPAASAIRGQSTNGWWFFLVDSASRRSLRDVWRDYVDSLAVDVEDDDADEDVDEDES